VIHTVDIENAINRKTAKSTENINLIVAILQALVREENTKREEDLQVIE